MGDTAVRQPRKLRSVKIDTSSAARPYKREGEIVLSGYLSGFTCVDMVSMPACGLRPDPLEGDRLVLGC